MAKRKLTADDIDMLMQESDFDSSESDHDDSFGPNGVIRYYP